MPRSTPETFYEVMRRQGITRRSFLKFCSLTATALGLAPSFAGKIARAVETKPRTPVIWRHGLDNSGKPRRCRHSRTRPRRRRRRPTS
jgi:Ni,Fe-hydrogenase I small subunit